MVMCPDVEPFFIKKPCQLQFFFVRALEASVVKKTLND